MASTRQPPWSHPQSSTHEPDLKVYNSLTKSKKPFVPREKQKISWYACGPTVYDEAHLGHARNYVSTDILRRILRDYFKFDVKFVMNITDVDDKIIIAGRRRYLYNEYQKQHRYIDKSVLEDVQKAWLAFIYNHLPRFDGSAPLTPMDFPAAADAAYGGVLRGQALEEGGKPGDKEAKVKMYLREALNTAKALTSDLKNLTPLAFYDYVKDPMCEMLDAELGKSIKGTDHHIFKELTEDYENKFFRDMQDLNVLPPDRLVRVTEFGDQIASFVDKIVDNKFAYDTADGSVYFDIKAFEAQGNPYARLEPWNRNDKSLQADGEGALSQKTSGKRSDADFALWKASKPGEPSWSSKWGPGRPGWHIECSCMASEVLGKQMDIHSGGIDLAFPHHDNELAQSEAYWSAGKSTQWVNYFLHMGHLSIQGSKMSKSLKNFTTIRTALDRGDWTSRSLRVVFLLGNWRDGIEITDDLVKAGQSFEDKVDNFFINAIEAVRTMEESDATPKLQDLLTAANSKIRDALLDSFNTPEVMATLSSLISDYNSQEKSTLTYRDHLDIAIFVTRMVNIFGLNGSGAADTTEIGWSGIAISDAAKVYVEPLSKIRDQLRQAAIAKTITHEKVEEIVNGASPPADATTNGHTQTGRLPRHNYAKVYNDFTADARSASATAPEHVNRAILQLCDKVRDIDLWNQDIYLEDRENLPALIRPVTAGLRAARKEKESRAAEKEEAQARRKAEAKTKLEKGRLEPKYMFAPPNWTQDTFSEWDEDGIPTKMEDGSAVPNSKVKKLKKLWESQRKANELYKKAIEDGTIEA